MWFAADHAVLISRCAWHPRYYGHSKLLGISNWRGLRIDFTDGICPKCAARVRVVLQRRVTGGRPIARRDDRISEVIVVALAVLTGLVLIARPANEGSTRLEVADLLPGAVTAEPTTPTAVVASPTQARRLTTAPAATVLLRLPPAVEPLQSP
jgi:hypothetical protein